jgi:hypothetical protein
MLGLVPRSARLCAYANGRPLHSAPFRLSDKRARPRAPLLYGFN